MKLEPEEIVLLTEDETKRINELCTDSLAPTYYVRRYLNACKKRKLDKDDK